MDFELFFNDLLKIYNVKTITDLAEKLNINRSTVAGWKNRETFAPILEYLFLNDKETLKNILNFDRTNNISIGNSGNLSNGGNFYNISNIEKETVFKDEFTLAILKKLIMKYENEENLQKALVELL
ncbi:helix-turn-helix domain-containing protein [Aliarcobacter butzleri]|uniref:helix-turn-helix domain-containing protein n=2 Tax=Aliarcobacter butzleri TaxID=28197 RepID=UPI001EDE8590|nr:helix-turn-helix domain-containing protein [Aliarcobacter butzleri]MCG3695421.1 helix-turn-helix domain containing protein [Aliarcobacter butzleri]MDN5054321.1 helix-turn-helix domain-containing protein [Aliarcobacter butzleri]